MSEDMVMLLVRREIPEKSLDLVERSLTWDVQTLYQWGKPVVYFQQ